MAQLREARGVLRSGTVLTLAILLIFAAALGYIFLRVPEKSESAPIAEAPARGGTLVTTLRSEPRTFNSLIGRDFATELITHLTQATLVRVNRVTDVLEPRLAESWTEEPGQRYVLKLRRNVKFSDGSPFSSDDVVFAFRAAYDEKTASSFGDTLRVEGKPLAAEAIDPATVRLTFPAPFGPGLRMLDRFPILPRHRLQAALDAGTLRQAWNPATPPGELAGLGPFVLATYEAGQRLQFVRNPNYWRRDAAGEPLPYLDSLTVEIVPDQNAEILRLQAGQIDFTQSEARAEDVGTLKPAAAQGKFRLLDLGVGTDADALWFNLRGQGQEAWRRVEFRRAVSRAVNRQAFADTVFLGATVPIFGPITPANRTWYEPDLPHDDYSMEEARRLLAAAGTKDARFTLVTQRGNTALERGAAFIRDELAKVGVTVDVVPLEVGALVEHLMKGNFEAIYFRFLMQSLDPGLNLDFWRSSGGAHVWNPEQPRPATGWEGAIDALMAKQSATTDQAERKRLVSQAQRLLADQEPIIYFAAPRIYLGVSTRTLNAHPSVMRPNLLWSADDIAAKK